MAVFLIVSSAAMAGWQAVTLEDIANGLLMYIAQAFLLAGSLLGLTTYERKLINYVKERDNRRTGGDSQ